MSLKRNVIANYLGQAWVGLMGIAFVPLYIRYLGIEAYGLIGVFVILQAALALLDAGLTPALSREMARFTAGAHSAQYIRDLLRTIELVCAGLAAIIVLAGQAGAGYLAVHWLNAEKMPVAVIAQALSVMALLVALRFIEGIYRGALFGLQMQVRFNVINALLVTVRQAGAIAILAWVSPTIHAFFLWHAGIALLSILLLAGSVRRGLPPAPQRARFSRQAIADVWKFSAGMVGIALFSLLLTQLDKILLSRFLPLQAFGYYTLAAAVASLLSMLVGPVTSSLYPRMVELGAREQPQLLAALYHAGAQLVTGLTAPVAALFWFFAGGIIYMWSGRADLAEHAGPILAVVGLGTFLNGLMALPYQLQLAHGWTTLALRANVVAVVILVPALFIVVPRYGALGAAWTWVALNTGYVLLLAQLMHLRLLPGDKWRWYRADVVLPAAGALGVALVMRAFQPAAYDSRWHWFVFLLVGGALALTTSFLLADHFRARLCATVAGRLARGS